MSTEFFKIPQEFIENEKAVGRIQRENFARAVKAGVRIAFGTDAGISPQDAEARAKPLPKRRDTAQVARIRAPKARLLTLVTDPHCGVSLDHVKEQLRELNVKIATLAEQARQHQTEGVEDSAEGRARALAFVQAIQAGWDSLDPGELRGLLAALAERIVITSKGALEYAWREPSAFVPAAGKASEAIQRLALPPTDGAPPMLDAANEARPTQIGASRVA